MHVVQTNRSTTFSLKEPNQELQSDLAQSKTCQLYHNVTLCSKIQDNSKVQN